MVVFSCGYCGDLVPKLKVEKHYHSKCKNKSPSLSCMDCFKDFSGSAYEEHTKCRTDEQHHSGKGHVAKEKKVEKKQHSWVELVQSVLYEEEDIPKNVVKIIQAISKHNNTPRKKPKFYNFVKNVCGSKTGAKDIERAWILLLPKLNSMASASQRNQKDESGKINIKKGHTDADSEESSQDDTTQDSLVAEYDEGKNLSKRERKEEKKRQKYETEVLRSKATLEEEEVDAKKATKKKNRTISLDGGTEALHGKKKKNRTTSLDGETFGIGIKKTNRAISLEGKTQSVKDKKMATRAMSLDGETFGIGIKKTNRAISLEGKTQSVKDKKMATRAMSLDGETEPLKGKKKNKLCKNRSISFQDETETIEVKKKNQRKRRDTGNSVSSNQEGTESMKLVQSEKKKTQKKNSKDDKDVVEGMSLHDQNVAKIRDLALTDKFDWHKVILSVLEKKGNELPFKRLQKKVLAEYSATTGREVDERIQEKFIKKLKSAPGVEVEKNKVSLLQ